MTIEAGFGVAGHEWLEESDGVVTQEEGSSIPFTLALRTITATATGGRHLLLGFNAELEQDEEESEVVARMCQSEGTLTDDDGEAWSVDSCEESVLGAPELTRTLSLRGGLGYMPTGYARYRLTAYPVVTLDLAPDAESVVSEAGLELLVHAHLGRLDPKDYAGPYKGILAFGPTLMWDPTNDDPQRPTIGFRVAVLAQKHLLDPTVGI
jgi:hypothetical protein